MGDTIYWINIEIDVFWFNIVIMALYLIWDNYFESIKTKLFRFNIYQELNSKALMNFYSPNNTSHDDKYENGWKNVINNNQAWVVDYNDVEQVEMMKEKVKTLIKEAKDEVKKTLGSKAVMYLTT